MLVGSNLCNTVNSAMKQILVLLTALAGISAQLNYENYTLIWDDQFDSLDLTKWQHEITAWGGGNSEFQVYTNDPANSYTQNGVLHLNATILTESINPATGQPFGDQFRVDGVLNLTELYGTCTNPENSGCYRIGPDIPPLVSARIRSSERFSFAYGRVKARIRLPVGDWKWPAFWMLPEYWVFGDWPRSGEIDIIEFKGNEDYVKPSDEWAGIQAFGTTLHWGPDGTENRFNLTHTEYVNDTNDFGRYYHIYELDWSENGISWYVDDVNVYNVPDPLIPDNPDWTGFWDYGAPYDGYTNPGWNTDMSPFDECFHFILNIAVGGTVGFFDDANINRGGDPANAKPWLNTDGYGPAMNQFIDDRAAWDWTWDKERNSAQGSVETMAIDYLEVYQRNDATPKDCSVPPPPPPPRN